MKRLLCIVVALAACVAFADISVAKLLSIVKSRSPGAKYSRPTSERIGGRSAWVVTATKDGQVRRFVVEKSSGRILSDTIVRRATVRSGRHQWTGRPHERERANHLPQGKAKGYYEHHKQGYYEHHKQGTVREVERKVERKVDRSVKRGVKSGHKRDVGHDSSDDEAAKHEDHHGNGHGKDDSRDRAKNTHGHEGHGH